MKKIATLVVILVLVTLSAYFVFGLLARKNCQAAIAELQVNFPGRIDSSYKQGFFTSELQIKLDIPIPDANPATPETISTRIRQTIHHGPFIFSNQNIPMFIPVQLYAQGSLEIDPFLTNEPAFVAQLRQLASTDITVHTPLNGRTKVVFKGKPMQSSLEVDTETFTLNWQGFDGHLFLEGNNLLSYDLNFRAPGLKIKGQGSEGIVIEEITAQAQMREGIHNLSLGTVSTAIKNLEAKWGSGTEEKITMTSLDIRITSNEQQELLRVEEEIQLDHLQFADKKFGPANLKISLANLDAKTVAKLTEAYKTMQANAADNEVMALGILSNHASALLAQSPEIRIENFSLTSPDGTCLSTAFIAFNGEGEVLLNPLFLLGRLSAEANFSADERFMAVQIKNIIKESLCGQRMDPGCDQEAARASSKQLQALTEQNILLLSNGKYTLTAGFKNGQAMLNGQPMPLSF